MDRTSAWDAVVIAVAYIVYIAVIIVGPVLFFRMFEKPRRKRK